MKKGLMSLAVAGVMLAGMGVAMAEEAAAPKADAPAKPHAARNEWKGALSAPAAGAAADVVAVLTVNKRNAAKTLNLTAADAEVVAKLKDGATKGATVVVIGEINKEETAVAVTKVTEPKAAGEKPPKAAGHHEKVQK
jgi:hypothetical protein